MRSPGSTPLSQADPVRASLLDPVADARWGSLVDSCADATIFHHPLWLALLRDSYRYPMAAVVLEGRNGDVIAGLPLATVRSPFTGTRLVSVPFSDVCGPITGGRPDLEPALLDAVDAERRRAKLRLEIHAALPTLPGSSQSERFFQHLVPLEGGRDVVLGKQIKQSKRRGAALALESGVRVDRRTDPEALETFFRLHVLTRHRLGVPTQPRRFFRGLSELLRQGLGFVLVAEWSGQAVAANVYLVTKNTLTYKYGASDPAHLDKRPNDLLHIEGLRIGCDLGCSELDLGRTEIGNEGLRRFKRQLGATERELTYTIAPARTQQKSVRSVSGLQQTVIRRAPPVFGRLLGASVYRHFG